MSKINKIIKNNYHNKEIDSLEMNFLINEQLKINCKKKKPSSIKKIKF